MKKDKINFKKNFKNYLSFIKESRLVFIFALIIGLIAEISLAFDKYLFKLFIDQSEVYSNTATMRNAYTDSVLYLASLLLVSIASFYCYKVCCKIFPTQQFDHLRL